MQTKLPHADGKFRITLTLRILQRPRRPKYKQDYEWSSHFEEIYIDDDECLRSRRSLLRLHWYFFCTNRL